MRALAPPLSRKHLYSFARFILLLGATTTTALLLWLSCTLVDPYEDFRVHSNVADGTIVNPEFSAVPPLGEPKENSRLMVKDNATLDAVEWERDQRAAFERTRRGTSCATVEEMGKVFAVGSEKEIPKIKNVILRHFDSHGVARVRGLPPDEFCHQGFVLGKASEAGFGNEMYKILTAAALSIMLNRSLIIGQTRDFYPFGDFVSYTNYSFSLKEVKHLWRKYDCAGKYGRSLQIRFDNFEHPAETNVLCSDWRLWKQPIIWFQGTTDAVAIQFFLKNINPGMRNAALELFGHTSSLQSRPNIFGELLKFMVTPTTAILEAVDWVLNGTDPDIALHMRMLTSRSVRAVKVAIKCIKMALHNYGLQIAKPRVVLVSDTPSFIKDISPNLTKFADVLYFDYEMFKGSISNFSMNMKKQSTDSRLKDWGPAPRWVAFVDFFLASRAKHAVVSGANRRVGTTYAQLIAALAAANSHGDASKNSRFAFFSSFQSNLLVNGLAKQVGWGHIWNRFAGPLSCHGQPDQCAFTPLLPPAWWDGEWQSPIPRDIRRMQAYGVQVTETGLVINTSLENHCKRRKDRIKIINVFPS